MANKKEINYAIKTCLPENRLELDYWDEIDCQVLERFREKGLNREDLLAIQKKLPIIYPWNDYNYQNYRTNYNRNINYFPTAIILCRSSLDVQKSLHFVKKYNFVFSVRSGGHCTLGYSLTTGIVIDLSLMDEIIVEQTKESIANADEIHCDRHVILGPGASLGVVIEQLSEYDISLPVGSCINTCVGGLTLGGGISPSLIRSSGLSIDHLIRAEIVLPNEKIIQVDKKNYSDLFFALRGAGGGNFGIVTKFIFNPVRYLGATVFKLQYPITEFSNVIDRWQRFFPFTDTRCSAELNLSSPKFNKYPIEIQGQFEGSEKELKTLLRNFISLAKSSKGTVFIDFISKFSDVGRFWGSTQQAYFNENSIFWYNFLSEDAIKIMLKYLENAPVPEARISFNAMLGKVAETSSSATAFPWRKALFWNHIVSNTQEPLLVPDQLSWVNKLYDDLLPYVKKIKNTIPAYVNMVQANLTLHRRYMRSYYGENRHRLIQIKTKYDPHNLFKFQQSIPLAK
ncbi:MAG: putative FAD-linked oxidoreductase YgaK [Harvfovirus sp.]|uniref:Putative FAD-linked oxidoreductase YgaK n=1 Tax=Harvfovirus sp. TaxID=2487768 RepID=A0A3G5A058_9VIRU|nr:MAG: putative FAD-linked oxidoreductase YgaK [Harvfovirus sp.]